VSLWSRAAFGWPSAARGRGRDRGAATAEFAVALPAFVLLLYAGLSSVNAVGTRLACIDAARDGAIAAARGDDGRAAARRRAPSGADISISRDGDVVVVVVAAVAKPIGGFLPGLPVSSTATALVEPGEP